LLVNSITLYRRLHARCSVADNTSEPIKKNTKKTYVTLTINKLNIFVVDTI